MKNSAAEQYEDWQILLDRAFEGDSDALGQICQDYLKPKLYSFALRWLKHPQGADGGFLPTTAERRRSG